MKSPKKPTAKVALDPGKKSPKTQVKPRGTVWAKWLAANAKALGLSSKEAKSQLIEKSFYQVVTERGLSRIEVLHDVSRQLVGFFQARTLATQRLATHVTTTVHAPKIIDAIAAKQARRAP